MTEVKHKLTYFESFCLANALIAELKRRKNNGTDLAAWLAQRGIVLTGTPFNEAMAVLQFVNPIKLAPIAAALGVTQISVSTVRANRLH